MLLLAGFTFRFRKWGRRSEKAQARSALLTNALQWPMLSGGKVGSGCAR